MEAMDASESLIPKLRFLDVADGSLNSISTVESCNNPDMSAVDDDVAKSHWVEKLFPPAFQFSLADLIGPKTSDQNRFEQLVRRISPEDIETIKNVYHRAWLILRNQKQSEGADLLSAKSVNVTEETTTDSRENIVGQRDSDLHVSVKEPLSDTCIWNSDEIGVLREVYKKIKDENIKLTSEIAVLKEEMIKLKKLERKEAKQLDVRTDELQDAIKANKRLDILSRYLKQEVDKSGRLVKDLSQQLTETEDANRTMEQKIVDLCKELDFVNLERIKMELEFKKEMDAVQMEARQKEELLTENFQKAHLQINAEVKKLSQELEHERELHKRTVRGLNHLRMHFGSSPPDESETDPNFLTKWTCY